MDTTEVKMCPQCSTIVDSNINRLIKEECGHSKCRDCFLKDENGCSQCQEVPSPQPAESPQPVIYAEPEPHRTVLHVIKGDRQVSEFDSGSNVIVYEVQAMPQEIEEIESRIIEEPEEYFDHELLYDEEVDEEDDRVSDALRSRCGPPKTSQQNNIPKHIQKLKVPNPSTGVVQVVFLCTICNRQFRSRSMRGYHLYCDPSVPKPFQCRICDKAMATRSHLDHHMQIHTNARFVCTDCGREFQHDSSLRKHQKTHRPDYRPPPRPQGSFACETCGKVFTHRDYLKKHQICHEREPRFKCSFCEKRYPRKNALKLHIESVHSTAQTQCSECKKWFATTATLERHRVLHSETRLFECIACGSQGRRKDNMLRHVRGFHPELDQAETVRCVSRRNMDLALVEGETEVEVEERPKSTAISVIRAVGKVRQTCEDPASPAVVSERAEESPAPPTPIRDSEEDDQSRSSAKSAPTETRLTPAPIPSKDQAFIQLYKRILGRDDEAEGPVESPEAPATSPRVEIMSPESVEEVVPSPQPPQVVHWKRKHQLSLNNAK